ncbi:MULTISPECIES: hypothetical protein [Microbacterium]|uniref:hypothetical protein n=1 Tax=Microbacterium TaxID=33882 RepID=UPI00146E0D2B|nr:MULTISPECIES: hypothetical protein [Microbacterium]
MGKRAVVVLSSVAALLGILLVVALVVVLGNAAAPASAPGAWVPTQEPTPTPTAAAPRDDSSPTATPTPGPAPTPSAAPTSPAGACTRVLTEPQLDDLLGAGWTTYDLPTEYMRRVSIGTLGGIECRWQSENIFTAGTGSLSVIILPADRVPPAFVDAYSPVRCEESSDGTVCRASAFAGDYWVMTQALAASDDLPTQMLERATGHVASTVGATFEGTARQRQADWLLLPECEDLARDIRLDEIIGTGYEHGDPWGASEAPEDAMIREAGVAVVCPWFSVDGSGPRGDSFFPTAILAAGGAWAWEAIAGLESAVAVDVEGAVGAVIPRPGEPWATLFVTDGVNLIGVYGLEGADRILVAERILGALQS